MIYHHDPARRLTLLQGDALEEMARVETGSVDCVLTSPPYFGLRDYGSAGQYGLEATPAEYVETLRKLFSEVHRTLAADGTLWLNLGDSYSGKANGGDSIGATRARARPLAVPARVNALASAPYKSLHGIPWRVAFALVDDGWTLRNSIIWEKPNAMPDSVRDRLSNRYETVFLFTKGPRYHFDLDAIRVPKTSVNTGHKFGGNSPDVGRRRGAVYTPTEKGKNPGDVWSITTKPFPEAHFATMLPALASRCVLAGCRPNGRVLDPFSGAGTTGQAALGAGRGYIGIELSTDYLDLSLRTRLAKS